MSRYDSLVLFFTSTSTTQATTSTSESLWLAGAIFPFFDNHTGHHTLISTWCGTTPNDNDNKSSVFSLISILFISFLYYNFTSTSSMNYKFIFKYNPL